MKLLKNRVSGAKVLVALFTSAVALLFTACESNQGSEKLEQKFSEIDTKVAVNKLKGFKTNIEKSTLGNKDFRKVLYTSEHSQLVLMSLKPKEDIGEETHPDIDQFFRVESGTGKCIINDTEYDIKDGDVFIIPAGAKHNVINTDATKELQVYTVYSPPNHKDGTVRKTKKDAEVNKEEFDGVTSEGSKSK